MRATAPRRAATATVLAVAALGLASCSSSSGGKQTGTDTAPTITVFAASSLTNAFAAEAAAFAQTTGQKTTFSFAGSQDLVAQIQQGAPADVVATADQTTMQKLPGGAGAKVFARNRLVIVTAKGNPKHITGLSDLARPGLVVVLAAPTVPAGKYAAQALAAAHVRVKPKSLEDNVRGVLTKVELGEADAGIAYVTDALSARGQVASVPVDNGPIAAYPVLALHSIGQKFVDFLLSSQGQDILKHYGFLPPS